jgi:zinc and cadmium transporter
LHLKYKQMSELGYILLFTLLGSVVSLIGGVILLVKGKLASKISHFLAAFAAGVLLGTAFIDLLPEALEHAEELGTEINIFLWTLGGVLIFFLLERIIHNFHHHGDLHSKNEIKEEKKATIPLIIFGDSFHNFIDGVVIAATFMVDINLGILTTFAVAAHEIPQEIGDFGLLLHRGLSRSKVLLVNFFSALTALIGAISTYLIGENIEGVLPILLALAGGFFIYIALASLIPEIHSEDRKQVALWETILLLSGVFVIYIALLSIQSIGAH